MLNTKRAGRKLGYMVGAAALLAAAGAAGNVQAQGFGFPKQGYESTSQNTADYNAQEKEAASIAIQLIETTNSKDQAAHLVLVDDNAAFRADPLELLQWGKQGYCSAYGFVADPAAWLGIDNMYVVGGPNDAVILMKRRDVNGPYDGQGFLGGLVVPLAVMLRVHNGKLVEWYDIPINKVSIGALPFSLPGIGGPQRVLERCQDQPVGGDPNPAPNQPTPDVEFATPVTWGTNYPEFLFNPEETAAVAAVRGFFAGRKAADPNLLGSFLDSGANGRPNPKDSLIKGRDPVLQNICGILGNDTITLNATYVVGADYNQAVLVDWTNKAADGTESTMASFFRLKDGKIVEWMDSNVDGPGPVADANSAACQSVNARIEAAAAAAAAAPAFGPPPDGAAPGGPPGGAPTGGLPPGAPPGAPPAGGPPPGAPPA